MLQDMSVTQLSNLLEAIESFAPPGLAEPWDNVGLIVSPLCPLDSFAVPRVLLTIDLTASVLDEAIAANSTVIVAYHPPLFQPIKRLNQNVPKERIILQAIHAGIAIYSPHTALDVASGGVNDWLASGLGAGECRPIEPRLCPDTSAPLPRVGQGRLLELDRPVPLGTLLDRLKRHLGLEHLRVSWGERHAESVVGRLALCAGAGVTVIQGQEADVYVTGEMRHHDVLELASLGKTVVLSEHTHTERGFLPVFRDILMKSLNPSPAFLISSQDGDPLQFV